MLSRSLTKTTTVAKKSKPKPKPPVEPEEEPHALRTTTDMEQADDVPDISSIAQPYVRAWIETLGAAGGEGKDAKAAKEGLQLYIQSLNVEKASEQQAVIQQIQELRELSLQTHTEEEDTDEYGHSPRQGGSPIQLVSGRRSPNRGATSGDGSQLSNEAGT